MKAVRHACTRTRTQAYAHELLGEQASVFVCMCVRALHACVHVRRRKQHKLTVSVGGMSTAGEGGAEFLCRLCSRLPPFAAPPIANSADRRLRCSDCRQQAAGSRVAEIAQGTSVGPASTGRLQTTQQGRCEHLRSSPAPDTLQCRRMHRSQAARHGEGDGGGGSW